MCVWKGGGVGVGEWRRGMMRKMSQSPHCQMFKVGEYDPRKVGSRRGDDDKPHDNGLKRALKVWEKDQVWRERGEDEEVDQAYRTLFVGRLDYELEEEQIKGVFQDKFGGVEKIDLVRDIKTGKSKGYAFIVFKGAREFQKAFDGGNGMKIGEREVLVDVCRGLVMKGWVPRRYGGGLGGKKESGQLRWGGRNDVRFVRGDRSSSRSSNRSSSSSGRRSGRRSRNGRERERDHRRDRDYDPDYDRRRSRSRYDDGDDDGDRRRDDGKGKEFRYEEDEERRKRRRR
eukprot:TRINITY_DN855_c0_g7_i1.p1 TRINITY_DN855_c0_g7~~TRINITY_DN855_c0_g7_i1.p1  ORF type:complete len:285 (-),score=55.94 TRINITY_DN855_c0_g7_i1:17-871(-)